MISEYTVTPLTPTQPDALVCVVDNDKAVRDCLERLLRSARFNVETYASAAAYLARRMHAGPVCLVLDVSMPQMDGFGLQQALAGRCEEIVFLTGHGDVPMCAKGMKAGASDFLIKPVDDEVLLAAVQQALDRARKHGRNNVEQKNARALLRALTARETEVMQRVIAGMLNKQIAADLGIAEKTVKIHRGRVMKKAGVASVPGLMRLIETAGNVSHQHHQPAAL
jgi:two-component system, LuxR family, response regulator FixJ